MVVELWTNVGDRLSTGSVLTVAGGRELMVTASSPAPGGSGGGAWPRFLVTFRDVSGREAADALRGEVLQAPRVELAGTLWVHELVGAELFDPSGVSVGRVAAVEANPASDLLILEDGRAVPLTFVDREQPSGRLVVDGPEGLLDL